MVAYQLASRKQLHHRAKAKKQQHRLGLLALLMLFATWFLLLAPTQLGGPITYAVISGKSMEPQLHSGDLVLSRVQSEYKKGDTVLTAVMGGYVIHNIVSIDSKSVKTKGINNDNADSWTLKPSQIMGKEEIVLPGVGNDLVFLRENPLLLGLAAAGLTTLLSIDFNRRRVSKRLESVLKNAVKEIPEPDRGFKVAIFTGMIVLTAGSVLTTGVLLATHTNFYPRLFLSLLGVVVSVVTFEYFGNWLLSGRDLKEPYKSFDIFKNRLYRLESGVEIPGATAPVFSASELLHYAEIDNSPILHLVSNAGNTHMFLVVSDDLNYVFRLDLAGSGLKK